MGYSVDLAATRAYWAQDDEQCDCLYCRNYRAALAECCPGAVRVLSALGLSYERALDIADLFWDDAGERRVYDAYYPVCGTLAEDGLIWRGDAVVTLYQADSPKLFCPTSRISRPYFMAVVSVRLPWVLDELP